MRHPSSTIAASLGRSIGARRRRPAPLLVFAAALTPALAGCWEPEADRLTDPAAKAAYHCRYVLERGLALPEEFSPDNVLRRRVADFAPPTVERTGERIRFTWPHGAILRRDSPAPHGGDCVIDLARGQYVESATLDGRPLHSGFSF